MSDTLYPDPPPAERVLPQALPGTFTQGSGAWSLASDAEDEPGIEVNNPVFAGMFIRPAGQWSLDAAVLGCLFRWPVATWSLNLTSPGGAASSGEVPPSEAALPDAGEPKLGDEA